MCVHQLSLSSQPELSVLGEVRGAAACWVGLWLQFGETWGSLALPCHLLCVHGSSLNG